MKIIFLDIDGVLNSRQTDARCALSGGDLMRPDPALVVRLLGVCQETGAKIVLSTSWRLDTTIVWPFPVYDVTPRLDAFGTRAAEIAAWLANTTEPVIENFVIVDDEGDAGLLHPTHFIQTDPRTGLTAEDAAKIVGLFT